MGNKRHRTPQQKQQKPLVTKGSMHSKLSSVFISLKELAAAPVTVFIALTLLYVWKTGGGSSNKNTGILPERWKVSSFTVNSGPHGKNPVPVTVIENFFPKEIADYLHEILEENWRLARPDDINLLTNDEIQVEDANRTWLYTSNSKGTNTKVRNNSHIRSRHAEALHNYQRNIFSYSKFELLNATILTTARRAIADQKIREAIQTLPHFEKAQVVGLADIFFAAYAKGNFLSAHNDYSAGSVALVISLSRDWKMEYGGNLYFYCTDVSDWCHTIVPGFNTAVLFRTRPISLFHSVDPVTIASNHIARRYAITSWFITSKDAVDPEFKAQVEMSNSYLF